MPKLRATAAFLGAALFAAGLSFGASLAEGETQAKGGHYTPAGLCLLVDKPDD
jgi:hypothetical protein